MVMDPFSAISLASAIVQFVDFSGKLISKSYQLYHSTNGALQENEELEKIISDVRSLNRGVISNVKSKDDKTSVSKDERSLEILAAECQKIADELLRVFGDLKVPQPHHKWSSINKAVATAWNKSKIEELTGRLKRLREQIDSRILDMMRFIALLFYLSLPLICILASSNLLF